MTGSCGLYILSTSKEHEEQLEHDLDKAKSSAQAEINQLETELKEMKKKLSDQEKRISGQNNYHE